MKKFRFALDRVRAYRKLQLESEQARLEQMFSQLRQTERMEEEIARQTREAADEVRSQERADAVVPTGQVASLAGFRGHVDRVNRKIAAHKQEVLRRIEQQRLAVVQASQRYEALERAREGALSAWWREFGREQENTAGELHLARLARMRRKDRS